MSPDSSDRFVALLRGINVGGRNKVPMAELRTLASELGWTGVATYINSGNVVFTSSKPDRSPSSARSSARAAVAIE